MEIEEEPKQASPSLGLPGYPPTNSPPAMGTQPLSPSRVLAEPSQAGSQVSVDGQHEHEWNVTVIPNKQCQQECK